VRVGVGTMAPSTSFSRPLKLRRAVSHWSRLSHASRLSSRSNG
jgi:hypothetical protein